GPSPDVGGFLEGGGRGQDAGGSRGRTGDAAWDGSGRQVASPVAAALGTGRVGLLITPWTEGHGTRQAMLPTVISDELPLPRSAKTLFRSAIDSSGQRVASGPQVVTINN